MHLRLFRSLPFGLDSLARKPIIVASYQHIQVGVVLRSIRTIILVLSEDMVQK